MTIYYKPTKHLEEKLITAKTLFNTKYGDKIGFKFDTPENVLSVDADLFYNAIVNDDVKITDDRLIFNCIMGKNEK